MFADCGQLPTLVDLTAASDAVLLAIGEHIRSGALVMLDIPAISDWRAQVVHACRAHLCPAPAVERYAAAMAGHIRRCWFGEASCA